MSYDGRDISQFGCLRHWGMIHQSTESFEPIKVFHPVLANAAMELLDLQMGIVSVLRKYRLWFAQSG